MSTTQDELQRLNLLLDPVLRIGVAHTFICGKLDLAPGGLEIFDGLLGGSGVGDNTVNVSHGTTIDAMRVTLDAMVDLWIDDGGAPGTMT